MGTTLHEVPTNLVDKVAQFDHALTATDVARLLCVNKLTVYRLAKEGRLPSFRIGTCLRFDPHNLSRWLREQGLQ